MRNKFLLAVLAMLLYASGLTAMATPYAVYCEGDLSLHLLDSDTEPTVGSTLESNSKEITKVWEIDLVTPYSGQYSPWSDASKATRVVIEESFQTVRPISCRNWFYNFKALTEITGLENLYTENVTNMSGMFFNCTALTELDLYDYENFNTRQVTDMSAMFYGCSKLTDLNFNNSSTSNVTDMSAMFSECTVLSYLSFSRYFSTSSVTNMSNMFKNCKALSSTSFNNIISKFNTANVSNMYSMFYGCSGLTSLKLSNFNTANVTSMEMMFRGCSSLESIVFSEKFNTEKVTNMYAMFMDCSNLQTVDLSMFNTENVTTMFWMFNGCKSLTSLDLSTFVNSKVTLLNRMFFGCQNLTSIVLGEDFCPSNITDLDGIFYNCSKLTSLDLSSFDTKNVTKMCDMFRDCSSLTELNLGKFDTANVTDMGTMFYQCSSLKELDLSNFDTSKVTKMGNMFYNCSSLKELDLSNFDTSNVTVMSSMFLGCSGLTELGLSNFDTSKVTSMSYLFYGCSGLTELDLSNFDTSNVTSMASMFAGCSGLTELDLSNFNTGNVTNMNSMFANCSSLISLNIKKFTSNYGATMEESFTGCDNLRLLDLSQSPNTSVPSSTTWRPLTYYSGDRAIWTNFPNEIVGNLCRHLMIDGTEDGYHQLLLRVPYEFTANKVTIKRKFEKDKPYTLYLPFAMDASQYGTFYTGGKFDETNNYVYFTKLNAAQTEANTPYMFIPSQDFPDGIEFEGEVAVSTTPEDAEADGLNGVYIKKGFTADEAAQKIYYGWAAGEFRWAQEGATVDACRVYFKLPSSAAAKAPAKIKAVFDEDTTGVNEIDGTANGIDAPIYNLNGQRVGEGYRGILIKKGVKTANF